MITLKQLKSKLKNKFGWENLGSDNNKWFVDNLLKDTIKAINYKSSCKNDSEMLLCGVCDKETKHDTTLINELHCLKCGNVAKE
jgi:hypothetical protein